MKYHGVKSHGAAAEPRVVAIPVEIRGLKGYSFCRRHQEGIMGGRKVTRTISLVPQTALKPNGMMFPPHRQKPVNTK